MATSTDLRSAIEEVQQSLPADQVQDQAAVAAFEPGAFDRLARRVGALPWWVISATVHAVVFLLIALLAVAAPPPNVDEVVIATEVVKQKPPEYDPAKKRDIFKNTKDVQSDTQVENPVVTHEPMETSDHFETDNNMDKQTSRGSEDAISDIPLGGTGTVGSIGVGGGGLAGVFGYRDGGGRKKAVGRWGGTEATESAVEAALRWLARHQEKDGHWDGKKWEAGNDQSDVGLTGLATLAFLGAGYTHKSGRFADNVQRAAKWLISQQRAADGAIGYKFSEPSHGSFGYLHAIAGLALAEAYGMSEPSRRDQFDLEIGAVAQKAVDYSIKVQQAPYSAWRYVPKEDPPDISVTGWYVMQLKSARIAGLKVDGAAFQGAINFVNKCTSKHDGSVGYTNDRGVPSTTGVGLVCRQFVGTPNGDPVLIQGADYLLKHLPKYDKDNGLCVWGPCTYYHWYYGTLAMFQMGGKYWESWNKALKETLPPNQCKGGPLDGSAADKDGSWDPLNTMDDYGGRVYTTAAGALSLEIYYRYLPMYSK